MGLITCELCKTAFDKSNLDDHLKGKKHLNNLKKGESVKEKVEKGLFVTGFYPESNKFFLEQLLSNYGKITSSFFHPKGKFAIFQFEQRESVDKLLQTNLYFYGKRLHLSRRKAPVETKRERVEVQESIIYSDETVNKVLNNSEGFEEQLNSLLQEICVSGETYSPKCLELGNDLKKMFQNHYPNCRVHMFGSSVTGLALKDSDLDVYIELNFHNETPEDTVKKVKSLFYKKPFLFANIVPIPKAKIPIIKFLHKTTMLQCDVSFKNFLAVCNSNLIRYYISLDRRIKPFLLFIKYWLKKHEISGSGKMSNYASIMLALFYLMQLPEPVIPSVFVLQSASPEKKFHENWECSFSEDPSVVPVTQNRSTLFELIHGYFRYFKDFEYATSIICPYLGRMMEKSTFITPLTLPDELKLYKDLVSQDKVLPLKLDHVVTCQDPFEQNYNIAYSISTKILRKFIAICSLASSICEEETSATDSADMSSSVLSKLVGEECVPIETVQKINVKLRRNILEDLITKAVNSKDITDENFANESFRLIEEKLMYILKEIFILECEAEEQAVRKSKVLKLDDSVDVSKDQENKTKSLSLNCRGKVNVWTSRRKRSQGKIFPPNSDDILLKEKIISSAICATEQQKESNYILDFIFALQYDNKIPEIQISLADRKSKKIQFGDFTNFFMNKVSILLEKAFLRDHGQMQLALLSKQKNKTSTSKK